MLATLQKAVILQKTGTAVPEMPASDINASDAAASATRIWAAAVEALFAGYVAARAAKTLRESEEGRQLIRLRQLASAPSASPSRRFAPHAL